MTCTLSSHSLLSATQSGLQRFSPDPAYFQHLHRMAAAYRVVRHLVLEFPGHSEMAALCASALVIPIAFCLFASFGAIVVISLHELRLAIPLHFWSAATVWWVWGI